MFLPAPPPPSEYFPRIYNLGTVSTFIWYISLHDYFAKKNSCSLRVFSLFDLIFLTHTIFLCFPYLGSPEKPPTVVPWHSLQSELRMMPSQLDTRKAPGVREKLEKPLQETSKSACPPSNVSNVPSSPSPGTASHHASRQRACVHTFS